MINLGRNLRNATKRHYQKLLGFIFRLLPNFTESRRVLRQGCQSVLNHSLWTKRDSIADAHFQNIRMKCFMKDNNGWAQHQASSVKRNVKNEELLIQSFKM